MPDNSLIRTEGQLSGTDYDELDRQLATNSLQYLCKNHLNFQDWDECHSEFETWYAHHRDKLFKIILMPRNHLKTSIITVGLTIQDVIRQPDVKILLASAVWDNARSFLSEIKEHLTVSQLPNLFGTFQSKVWNQNEIVIAGRKRPDKTPSIDTAGIEKTLTSQHYDIIRADDLVTRENITTSEQLKKVKNFHNDLLKLANPKGGKVELIGTHWSHADLYTDLMEENKMLLEQGEPEKYVTYIRSATKDGTFDTLPIFPKMFTIDKLKSLRSSLGSYDYGCNYNNKPISDKDRVFKPPVRYFGDLGKCPTYFIGVDLAIEEKETSDFTVIAVCALTESNQFCVVEYARGHFNYKEIIEKIFAFVVRYMAQQSVKKVAIESNQFQKLMSKLVEEEQRRTGIFFTIEKIVNFKEKIARIRRLQPRWESGNLLLKQGMVELEDELEKFPVAKHDDILDAIEMAERVAQYIPKSENKVLIPRQFRRPGGYI